MVFAAPVALLAYSRRFRQIAYENKQGFFNLAIGSFATVLALRNIRTTVRVLQAISAHSCCRTLLPHAVTGKPERVAANV